MVKYVDFELTAEGAKTPFKKHIGDAGWDLYISEDCVIRPHETKDVHTGIKIKMPPFTYARITGRSSTLRKHKLLVNEAIIDNGYTGELFICVHNLSNQDFMVTKGMRLAQVLFHTIQDIRWAQVDRIQSIAGERGDEGFGSTGL